MDIKTLCKEAHNTAKNSGFWEVFDNGEVKPRNSGELIALIHSEVSEALEGLRHNDWKNVAEEMADTMIRIGDFCEANKIDLEKAIIDKMEYNKLRPKKHGKAF